MKREKTALSRRRDEVMTRVVVTETLRGLLHNLSQPLELCDEAGRVLGRVFPAADLSQYEPWEPTFNADELRRQEQSNEKRYTTAEVLAHLEKL
jgi:hypothetical protein